MDSSTTVCWTSPFVIEGVPGPFCHFNSIFDGKILLAISGDPALAKEGLEYWGGGARFRIIGGGWSRGAKFPAGT